MHKTTMMVLFWKNSGEKPLTIFKKVSILDVWLSSKYASAAGLSAYKDIFLGILWNVQNILSVEQLWTTFSKLFKDLV